MEKKSPDRIRSNRPVRRSGLGAWTPMLFALVPLAVMLWVVPATAATLG